MVAIEKNLRSTRVEMADDEKMDLGKATSLGIMTAGLTALKEWCDKNYGMNMRDVMTAVSLWFVAQPRAAQHAILRQHPEELRENYAELLEKLAADVRAGKIAVPEISASHWIKIQQDMEVQVLRDKLKKLAPNALTVKQHPAQADEASDAAARMAQFQKQHGTKNPRRKQDPSGDSQKSTGT